MKLRTFGALLASFFAMPAAAQAYPAKSILVISPVQAGSAGDTVLRLVTQKMSQNMGQQLLVENTTGAAGIKLNRVPYRGATQAAVDVQAGHLPVMFSDRKSVV